MFDAAASLVPVFLLIASGAAMRHWHFPGDEFWPLAERATYYVFFPALLVRSLANADLGGFDPLPMAGALLFGICGLAALLVLFRRQIGASGPAFSSIFQGAVRFNTFVGLGVVAALYGQAGVTLFAVAIAIAVPSLNVLCVAALARYADAAGLRPSWRRQLLLMRQNPLILACLLGISLNVVGLGLPWGIGPVLDTLGRAALPIGLLAVGAGLDLAQARADGGLVALAVALKLVALPLLVALGCVLFEVDGLTRTVAILWATLPPASSAYVLARQMGGDARLMASIITAGTLAAIVAMPLMLAALQ
jgi:hypothetical protein